MTTHVRILQAYTCYNAYGDDEGLTADEVARYDRRFGEGPAHVLPDTEEEFSRCELTGLYGATVLVQTDD
jgi:hypothetical protein